MGMGTERVTDQEFRDWVDNVRDPARQNSEGLRELKLKNGAATANYEVAELPSGEWAITIHCSYSCGNFSGVGIPWSAFPSRADCLDFFLKTARRHFQRPPHPFDSDVQRVAQQQMIDLLDDGLFGFCEPDPLHSGRKPNLS